VSNHDVTRKNHARAPQGANRTCRNGRGPEGARRGDWARSLARANRTIYATARLIGSTLRDVAACARHVHRRPIRTSRNLDKATSQLCDASARLVMAMRELGKTTDRMARDLENTAGAPQLVIESTQACVQVAALLSVVADDVFAFHEDVLHDLVTGTLVPEQPAGRRPRIVLAPRPTPVRAFLRLRQPRVIDRIASILHRRQRMPRPAALTVPPATHQGRAPPLFPVCPL
jgi:hypothetical protein